MYIKPSLLAGGCSCAISALAHASAFWSMHIGSGPGVAVLSGMQVNALLPLRRVRIFPSAPIATIVASFATRAGAAFIALAIMCASLGALVPAACTAVTATSMLATIVSGYFSPGVCMATSTVICDGRSGVPLNSFCRYPGPVNCCTRGFRGRRQRHRPKRTATWRKQLQSRCGAACCRPLAIRAKTWAAATEQRPACLVDRAAFVHAERNAHRIQQGKAIVRFRAQVHGVVRQAGGFVDVESAMGLGSTVTHAFLRLKLPSVHPSGADAEAISSASALSATHVAHGEFRMMLHMSTRWKLASLNARKSSLNVPKVVAGRSFKASWKVSMMSRLNAASRG